jgi:ATP-dependent RNA/DNA helicase IGHMBP2
LFYAYPCNMKKEVEELIRLQGLLKIERDEDLKQYNEQFTRCGVTERRKNGLTWYPVVIVNTEIGLGEYLVLEIERTTHHNEPHQFSGGKSAALFSNTGEGDDAAQVQGVIKNVSGNRMKLALNIDELPDWAYDGKLGVNLLFDENSYREMDIALHKVMNAENNRLAELRAVLLGEAAPSFDKKDEKVVITTLNASQNDAVRNILSAKDVAIVHGPPGTGKTTTLVQAIRYTLRTEKQVLVCSPSNTAVDLLTEKLAREGINVLRLRNPARISEEVVSNTLDAKVTRHENYKDLKHYRKMAAEYRSMAQKYKRNFGKAEREQRQLLFAEARAILKEASALEDYILNEQFEKAEVIACTPVISAGRQLRDKQFKTVFIDEAAQALEPMSWIPITRADRVIFAGDHFQLPPTVKSKQAEAEGLKISLFEKCIERQPQCAVMLNTQYRMNEHIMNFSNHKFYHDGLKADFSVKDHVLSYDSAFPVLNAPVDFIDTAGCGFSEAINPESLSLANPEEANLLFRYLGMVMDQYESAGMGDRKITIGIISPYKEQVELLQQTLPQQPQLQKYLPWISVKTIDGFQGQERDAIFISLVRSNDSGEIGFLSDTRRMNVALTRAKRKLVVIGDSATLSYNRFYKDFLEYIDRIGAYHTAWEFGEW